MIKTTNKTKAFTMVETIVSICLFGFISIVLINVFISAVKAQTRILQNQELMDQSVYALEYIGKSLRTAQRDALGTCTGTAGLNYNTSSGIIFLAYDTVENEYRCRQFVVENNIIMEKRSPDENSSNLGTSQAMTSSKVKINGLTFGVTGDVSNDMVQPKVTIMINMESNTPQNPPKIIVQTSVSQRELDF